MSPEPVDPPVASRSSEALQPVARALDSVLSTGATPSSAVLLEALFELAPVGILLMDPQAMAPRRVNAAMVELTGFSSSELLAGAGHRDPPAGLVRQRELINQQLAARGRFGPLESQIVRKGGELLHVTLCGAEVRDERGQPLIWVIVQDLTQRKAVEQHLARAAQFDQLTGLPNRLGLMQQLERLCSNLGTPGGEGFALMFLDFDHFKRVNDTLGHPVGDQLLCGVAARLLAIPPAAARWVRSDWLAARFGGDEFVLVVPGMTEESAVRDFCAGLMAELRRPHTVGGKEIHFSASIGVAIAGSAGVEPHALLRDADTAMYEAKRGGRGRLAIFDAGMHQRLKRSVQIEAALRHAVERGELEVVYQPIVDLDSGVMTSVESLLRWHSPELGTVSPAEFIPVAEQSGLIIEIGEYVLRESCRQWARWQREDPARAPAVVSVNLSRAQTTLGPLLRQLVATALAEAGMPAPALQLEITEREVMKEPAITLQLLHDLRRMGVRLAMDDFGTGTSSLACLREYPFDVVKIDKSFVTDLCRDAHVLAVAHATINVIENLDMISVAEGIEEAGEVAALQAMGCRYGQGFLFSRPLPADRLLSAMCAGARPEEGGEHDC